MKDQKKYCDGSTSWNCCFAKDTKIIVNENNKIVEKNISDIKKDDLERKSLQKLNIQKNMMMNLNFMNLNV